METPPQEAVTAARRTTRSALAEIPARIGAISFADTVTTPVTRLSAASLSNIPASYVSPSPSPDELVIQQRGRRKVPVTFSPDIDARKRERTPVKCSPGKSQIVLRSTPRKRLLLNDPKELYPTPPAAAAAIAADMSPDKRKILSPNAKKVRVESRTAYEWGGVGGDDCVGGEGLESALRGLSNDQLITVIRGIVAKHADIEQEIKECLPAPDLRPLEYRLNELKRNIYKSLPNSRLTSKTDSPAYGRAALHVVAFKKCVLEQGRQLVEARQWPSVLEYACMAWAYVRATPLWDNPPHNAARRQCFKALAAQCVTALRRAQLPSPTHAQLLYVQMESFVNDSEDFQTVLKLLETYRKK